MEDNMMENTFCTVRALQNKWNKMACMLTGFSNFYNLDEKTLGVKRTQLEYLILFNFFQQDFDNAIIQSSLKIKGNK